MPVEQLEARLRAVEDPVLQGKLTKALGVLSRSFALYRRVELGAKKREQLPWLHGGRAGVRHRRGARGRWVSRLARAPLHRLHGDPRMRAADLAPSPRTGATSSR